MSELVSLFWDTLPLEISTPSPSTLFLSIILVVLGLRVLHQSLTQEADRARQQTLSSQDLDPAELSKLHEKVYRFCTENASSKTTLNHFRPIQSKSECIFARKAIVWGNVGWNEALSIEDNVRRSIPLLIKFCAYCQVLKLDGFVFELPEKYGQDLRTFGSAVYHVLKAVSDADPCKRRCMDSYYLDKRGWVFEFDRATFFVTTFAQCYPDNHPRTTFGVQSCFILLQPELSFLLHDLEPDSPHTNWDAPVTRRDQIRVAFRNAGKAYPIRETVHYPMAHDLVRGVDVNEVVDWWNWRE